MNQMIPRRPVMPPSSSNHYDLNQPYQAAQYNNPKKLGKPHGTQTSIHTLLMYFLTSLAHHIFLSRFTFPFQLKPLLILVLSQVPSPSIFHKVQSQCPNMVSQYNPSSSTVKVANGTFLVTCGSFNP